MTLAGEGAEPSPESFQ